MINLIGIPGIVLLCLFIGIALLILTPSEKDNL